MRYRHYLAELLLFSSDAAPITYVSFVPLGPVSGHRGTYVRKCQSHQGQIEQTEHEKNPLTEQADCAAGFTVS